MSKRVTIAKAGACALAGAITLAATVPAQAQTSSYQGTGSYTAQSPNGYYYDPCRREATQRGTVGAVLGGTAGAVIGSNAAARNARTEGALLGGLLGAIAGGVVGNKTAACQPQYGPPPASSASGSYYQRDSYADRNDGRYDSRYAEGRYTEGRYTEGRYTDSRDRDDDYAYGRHGERYAVAHDRAPDPDGCTLAESPIYMPDGRTQTRFVRVCRDSTGRYAVVD